MKLISFLYAIGVFFLVQDAWGYERVGYFCSSCTTDAQARQKALNSVPRPECDWGPYNLTEDPFSREGFHGVPWAKLRKAAVSMYSGSLPECGAPLRQAVAVNYTTNQLFSYIVAWDQAQWDYEILWVEPLSGDEVSAHQLLIEFRNDWLDTVFDPISAIGPNSTTSTAKQRNGLLDDCDLGHEWDTALDAVVFSEARGNSQSRVVQHVEENLSHYAENQPWANSLNLGVTYRGIGVQAQHEFTAPDELDTVVLTYPENEFGSSGDYLTWEVSLVGMASNGQPAVTMDLMENASMVLGHLLPDVLSGEVNVEGNSCVRDKLATLAEQHGHSEWRARGGPVIDPNVLRGAPASGSGPLCYVDFYQGGQRLYTFLVSCDRTR